jgi:small subunit ribosomal protein S5
MKPSQAKKDKEFSERVVKINRVTRVVKGGRRLRFRATVVIGDHKNRVGLGVAKAAEVSDAVAKAVNAAKNNIITIPISNNTIPHQIIGKSGAANILMKPAKAGIGIIAGGAVREIMEISGIKNIVCKNIGTSNKISCSLATLDGLSHLRTKKEIYGQRGIEYKEKSAIPSAGQPANQSTDPAATKPVKKTKAKTDKSAQSPKAKKSPKTPA